MVSETELDAFFFNCHVSCIHEHSNKRWILEYWLPGGNGALT